VRPREAAIRAECGALYDKLSQLAPASGATSTYVDLTLIWPATATDFTAHAACVADHPFQPPGFLLGNSLGGFPGPGATLAFRSRPKLRFG